MRQQRGARGLLAALILLGSIAAVPANVAATTGPNALPNPGPDALIPVGPTGFDGDSQTSDAVNGFGDDQWQLSLTQPQTVSITVRDGFIVGDNFTIFLDGVPLGTTPAVPLNGPAYSFGTYTTSVAPGTHLITVQDIGGVLYYNQGATYMIPAGYFVTISFTAVTKPVMFVHGWNARFDTSNWDGVLAKLSAAAGEPVARFEYYQDLGSIQSGTCTSRPATIPQLPDGGMPADLGSIDDHICDSSSSIGLNAVLLDQEIQAAFAATNQPVVIVSNSMGAAIVRGFLAYSAERGDGVASQMTDSVFFLEGAQDGPYLGNVTKLSGLLSPVEQGLQQFGVLAGVPDVARPAGKDLTPGSIWYGWTNPPANHLPPLAYFNAFGDISIVTQECLLLGNVCFDVPIPGPTVGDVLLLPGTDNPHDAPDLGGARFLSGAPGAQNWQWTLPATAHWKPWTDPFFVGAVQEAANTAVFHGNFGTQMHSINVPDCRTGRPTPFDDELVRVLVERVNGLTNNCGS